MTRRYLIGLDYGTESARGVLVDVESGKQVASHAVPYRHGVMTRLLEGPALPPLWALQNADDYIEAAQALARIPCFLRSGDGQSPAVCAELAF